MKSKISRPEAEAELIAINRALQEAADLAQIMPHHGQVITPEMRDCLSERARQIKALHERAVVLHSRVRASGLDRQISSWAAELKLIIERTVGELLGCLGRSGC